MGKPARVHSVSKLSGTDKTACGRPANGPRNVIITGYQDLVTCKQCQAVLGRDVL